MNTVALRQPSARYALTDPALFQDRLFRPLTKEKGGAPGYKVTVNRNGIAITFATVDGLGHNHWRILVAVAALAGIDDVKIDSSTPDTHPARPLWAKLGLDAESSAQPSLYWRGSAYTLLRAAGMKANTKNRRRLLEYLVSLSSVTQTWRTPNRVVAPGSLLKFAAEKDPDTEALQDVAIVLSPAQAKAVLGGQFARVSLTELARLESAPAVLLHAQLVHLVDEGRTRVIGIDRLAERVYGEATGGAARRHRAAVRSALVELADKLPSWKIEESPNGLQARISRPKVAADNRESWSRPAPKPAADTRVLSRTL